ncbi:hypothetical protein HZS_5554 [Henneguya salminicola]|nr:hypothetical protein HZS_5554 [Henneguya salminicola]
MDPDWLPEIEPPDILNFLDQERSLVDELKLNLRLLIMVNTNKMSLATSSKFSIPSLPKGANDTQPNEHEDAINIVDMSSDSQDE